MGKRVWCVEHKDGWCATAYQPKSEPRYRDRVKTKCNHWVILPWGFAKRVPTCMECK